MPKTKQEKEEIVKKLTDKFTRSKSVVFVSFSGLDVPASQQFRKSVKEKNSEVLVAKKTLMAIALKNSGIDEAVIENFDKEVAAVFSYGDEVAGPKMAAEFAKGKEAVQILGGLLMDHPAGQHFLSQQEAKSLAALPSKEELWARLVGSIKAPVSGLVNALSGNLRNLINVLSAIKEVKS